jgi:tRNA(Ile)-lysidine synthase
MLQKFTTHIDANFPFLKDKKLLIAISGGLDSVVLTHLFSALNYTISLAHCNFKLRETASDLDEKFVRNISQKTYVFETEKYAKESKTSTQIAARELRYTWFQEIIKKNNFDFVLTAHHADDNLETFLINLTRGSGLDGFTGIPEINGNIIRPLLPFSRAEIMEYAKENKIEWREDASNATTKYIRNKIRHQVVPVLKEINPSLLTSFQKTVDNLQESQQIIEDRIKDVSLGIIEKDSSDNLQITKINIDKLQQLSNPKAYLYQFLKDYHFTAWNDVYHLLSAQSGKQVFSNTHRLLKNRKFLLLSRKIEIKNQQPKEYFIQKHDLKITHPIALTLEDVQQISTENKNTIYVDKALLKYPLIVRNWQIGDYLYPLGMQGKKKLSKYFKDEKFSLLEKEHTWLLCNADNQIIWVIHHRQDSRLSTENTSKNILKITSK